MYIEVIVEFQTDNGNGKLKKNRESYLVDAMTVTEAEALVHSHFKTSVAPFEVKSAKVSRVLDIIKSKTAA